MRILVIAMMLLGFTLLGCGASHRVSKPEVAKAKTQFEAIDATQKSLHVTTVLRLRNIAQSKLKPDAQYAFRRQVMRKHSADARKILVRYVRLANTQPKDKTAHTWIYAAFVRGAFIFDEMGRFAGMLHQHYIKQGKQAEAAYFRGIAKKANRGAYAGFMRVLFLGYHFHQVDAEDSTHTAAGNLWLKLANQRRCELAKVEKLSETEQSNLTWGMFKSAQPSQLHLSGADLRGQLMRFMAVPTFGVCK